MGGTGPVAGLAADIDLEPGRVEGLGFGIVVFFQIGGMAFGAHTVPVLSAAGPAQPVVMRDVAIRIQVEPLFQLGVPGDGQALHSAAWKGYQVLLQRFVAEGVSDLEVPHLSARAGRVDEELSAAPEETARDSLADEFGTVEIAEDGAVGGHIHGLVVVTVKPGLEFGFVAGFAFVPTDEGRRGGCQFWCRSMTLLQHVHGNQQDD
jgi:hypothetical protein